MRERHRITAAIAACALLVSGDAQAADGIEKLNGTYELACESAAISANLDVAGPGGEAHVSFPIPLLCDSESDDAQAAIAAAIQDLTAACVNVGLPEPACTDWATGVVDGFVAMNDTLIGGLPQSWSPAVKNPNDLWAKWLDLYTFAGPATRFDGKPTYLSVALKSSGKMGALGITVPWAKAAEGVGCIAVGAAGVSGAIDATSTPYALTARYGASASLTCLAAQPEWWIAAKVDLGVAGSMSGEKIP